MFSTLNRMNTLLSSFICTQGYQPFFEISSGSWYFISKEIPRYICLDRFWQCQCILSRAVWGWVWRACCENRVKRTRCWSFPFSLTLKCPYAEGGVQLHACKPLLLPGSHCHPRRPLVSCHVCPTYIPETTWHCKCATGIDDIFDIFLWCHKRQLVHY